MDFNSYWTWKVVLFLFSVLFSFLFCGYGAIIWIAIVCVSAASVPFATNSAVMQKNFVFFVKWCTPLAKKFGKSIENFCLSIFASSTSTLHEPSTGQGSKTIKENDIHCWSIEGCVDIDTCLHFIVRDFVMSWYQSISCNNQFSKEIYFVLDDLSVALYSTLRKVNKYKLAKNLVTLYHFHFKQYLHCLENVNDESMKVSGENYASESDPHFSSWHPALVSSESELFYMQQVVNILLEVLTPADLLHCTLARKTLVDIIAKNVMVPLATLISDPDWVNRKLILLLTEDSEQSIDTSCMQDDQSRMTVSTGQETDMYVKQVAHEKFITDTVNQETWVVAPDTPNTIVTNSDSHKAENCESSTEIADEALPERPTFLDIMDQLIKDQPNLENNSLLDPNLKEINVQTCALNKSNLNGRPHKQVTSSKSFEHLSSFVSNVRGELEKPIEFITGNFAQYFHIAGEDVSSRHHLNKKDSPTNPKSNVTEELSSSNASFFHRRRSTSIIEQNHSISHALEDAMTASAGPLLAKKFQDFKAQPPQAQDLFGSAISRAFSLTSDIIPTTSLSSSTVPFVEAATIPESSFANETVQQKQDLNFLSCETSGEKSQNEAFSTEQNGSVMEAVEMSPDNRCFMNLFISSYEIAEEPGGMGRYVLYCIEYEAWYMDIPSEPVTEHSSLVDISEPRMVLQGTQVKRRFREFVALSLRMDENPHLKPLLHNISKPNRRRTFPFNKIDKDTIEDRQIFLEQYLQKLIQIEEVASSSEFREFLAYGGDASIAYVKNLSDSMVPRIDKFLARKWSGMLEKFKSSFPAVPMDSPINLSTKQNERKSFLGIQFGSQDAYPINVRFGFLEKEFELVNLEENMRRIINENKNTVYADGLSQLKEEEILSPFPETPSLLSPDRAFEHFNIFCSHCQSKPIDSAEESESSFIDENNGTRCMICIDQDMPLASSLINLGLDGITNTNSLYKKVKLIYFFKLVVGPYFETWLCTKIDEYTSMEKNLHYLRQLRNAIWPGGVLPMESDPVRTKEEKSRTRAQALGKLKEFFPRLFPLFLGENEYDKCMSLFLNSLQHPRLLKQMFYNTVDLLMDTLVPETKSETFRKRFSNNSI